MQKIFRRMRWGYRRNKFFWTRIVPGGFAFVAFLLFLFSNAEFQQMMAGSLLSQEFKNRTGRDVPVSIVGGSFEAGFEIKTGIERRRADGSVESLGQITGRALAPGGPDFEGKMEDRGKTRTITTDGPNVILQTE